MKTNLIKVACGLTLLSTALTAPAQSLLSTLGSTPGNNWFTGSGGFTVAQEFTTGSLSELIASVSVAIGPISSAGSDFTVSLYSDASGQPGTLLNQLAGPTTPTSSAVNAYTASGLTLTASTVYWLVFDNPASGSTVYVQNTDTGGSLVTTSSAGWSLGNTEIVPTGSKPYEIYPNAVPLFSIDASPVPEPAPLTLSALGGLGWLWQIRRRK
jgi:hypothetical protein